MLLKQDIILYLLGIVLTNIYLNVTTFGVFIFANQSTKCALNLFSMSRMVYVGSNPNLITVFMIIIISQRRQVAH